MTEDKETAARKEAAGHGERGRDAAYSKAGMERDIRARSGWNVRQGGKAEARSASRNRNGRSSAGHRENRPIPDARPPACGRTDWK